MVGKVQKGKFKSPQVKMQTTLRLGGGSKLSSYDKFGLAFSHSCGVEGVLSMASLKKWEGEGVDFFLRTRMSPLMLISMQDL